MEVYEYVGESELYPLGELFTLLGFGSGDRAIVQAESGEIAFISPETWESEFAYLGLAKDLLTD